jgi:hypothetical protein
MPFPKGQELFKTVILYVATAIVWGGWALLIGYWIFSYRVLDFPCCRSLHRELGAFSRSPAVRAAPTRKMNPEPVINSSGDDIPTRAHRKIQPQPV